MISFDFGPFSDALTEPFERLFAQEGFERSPAYLDWAFRSGAGQGWAAVARDNQRDGTVVGVLALLPTRVGTTSGAVNGFQAVDLVVDPGYRGRGIFMGLGTAVLQGAEGLGSTMVWGFPNESAAHAWFDRFGWLKLGLVPFMVRPLRTGFFLRRLHPVLASFDVRVPVRGSPNARVRAIDRFGSDADRLWEQFSSSIGCAVTRDSDWLNWRIFDRPQSKYRTMALFDEEGAMRAFVTSTIANRYGGTVMFVMEALDRGGEPESLARLLRHELAAGARAGAEAALCWCPATAPNQRAYRKAGFLSIPERLRPVHTYHGVKPLGPLPARATSTDGWYISLLDSDAF